MLKRRSVRTATVAVIATFGLIAAACAPPPPPEPVNYKFEATSMHSVDSQDEVRLFGECVAIPNCDDEPYLLTVAFRVKIGEPGSAQSWVVKGSTFSGVSEGDTVALSGGQRGTVSFPGIMPLDVLDALNPDNKLEVFGTYTWAAEEDLINSLSGGANTVSDIFEDALNDLVASSTLPDEDVNGLIDMILDLLFDDFGSAFRLILSNIPCFGLCDDVLGGRVYLGIGVTGALGSLVDSAIAGQTIPAINLVGDNSVPPNIQGGGLFTLTGPKTFENQNFVGAGGHHQYTFVAGPA